MALSDQRMTALEIVNDVRRKRKLNPITTFDADSDGLTSLDMLNDVISDVADYDNWQELLREVTVTARSSVSDYSIPVSAVTVVQNIHEVVFNGRPGEMRLVDIDTIRRLQRARSFGEPNQWAIKGVDENGNPYFSVSQIPGPMQDGKLFNVLVYEKPAFITTAQTNIVPPFPGALLSQGLLVKMILNESDGEPTSRYQAENENYKETLYETYNRYNGDTGSTIFFRPARGRR